jgi:hypothetical protein
VVDYLSICKYYSKLINIVIETTRRSCQTVVKCETVCTESHDERESARAQNPIVTWLPPADHTKSEFPVSRSKSAQEIVSAKPRRWLWPGIPGPVFLESMGEIDLALRNLKCCMSLQLYESMALWCYSLYELLEASTIL